MSDLYDPIRKIWVKATPEECVRQNLLRLMLEERGFPPGLLGVEVSLRQLLPNATTVPRRRLDLIAYTRDHKPLLVVECKSVSLTPAALEQVKSYNHFLKCPFLCVANGDELRLGWRQGADWQWAADLPSYASLLSSLQK